MLVQPHMQLGYVGLDKRPVSNVQMQERKESNNNYGISFKEYYYN